MISSYGKIASQFTLCSGMRKLKPQRVEPSEALTIAKYDKCVGIYGRVEMENRNVVGYGVTV
jgi:hypothetical protein